MTTEIVKLNPADYGLDEKKAAQIKAVFLPMIEAMEKLETEYNEIVSQDITPELCSKAKALRLRYVRVRTATAEVHKSAKQFYLNGGRFVDGWKNAQVFASTGIEEKLESIEKHYEIIEQERKNKLRDERMAELTKYEVDGTFVSLGEMTDDVWKNYFSGVQLQYENKKAAEKKAEEDRLAAIEREKIERYRLNKMMELGLRHEGENFAFRDIILRWDFLIDLNDEEFEGVFQVAKARKEQIEKEEADHLRKLEKEKAEIEKEQKIAREKWEKEQRELNNRLEKERLSKEKAEALIKEKLLNEKKEEDAKKKAEKKAAAAPDKEKLLAYIAKIKDISIPIVKTEDANDFLLAFIQRLEEATEELAKNASEL